MNADSEVFKRSLLNALAHMIRATRQGKKPVKPPI